MANDEISLYNFYFDYLWRAQDFEGWQTGMVDHSRGMFEGLFNGAVLQGFELEAVSGTSTPTIRVSPGIASGPSGFLHVINEETLIEVSAPTGELERAILVVRPSLVDAEPITVPDTPFENVPLRTLQQSVIEVLRGVESATPEYASKSDNDVILCGLRIETGQTEFVTSDIDLEVRDVPGSNSNFQQNFGKYDARLRPFRHDRKTLGIFPSQLEPPFPRAFSYVNKQTPSIYPKSSGGDYNGSAGASLYDLQAGTVAGADEVSASFTPTIPSAGNAIVLYFGISNTDTIVTSYGTEGTRAECVDAIINVRELGAGAVAFVSGTKPVCLCLIESEDGSTVSQFDFFDLRNFTAIGAESGGGVATTGTTKPLDGAYPLTLDDDYNGIVILVDTTSAAKTITLPPNVAGFTFSVKDVAGSFGTNAVTIARPKIVKIKVV